MSHNKVVILDIPVSNINLAEFLENVFTKMDTQQDSTFIVTANPEIIMNAKKSSSYRDAILQADYIVPDGSGIIMASKILNQPLVQKITGYDLVHTFLAYASMHDKSIYFFGSKEGVAAKAAENAKQLYSGLKIAGTKNGYMNLEMETAVEIAHTKPDFLFLGLGAPMQEQWAVKYRHLFPGTVIMGVGGSFDVLSGNSKRAPQFWLDNNLEWLYRLITQPARSKRMLQLPIYLANVYKQKWKIRKS